MSMRMAGFELAGRKELIPREKVLDASGKVDIDRLVEQVNKLSLELSREAKLLEKL